MAFGKKKSKGAKAPVAGLPLPPPPGGLPLPPLPATPALPTPPGGHPLPPLPATPTLPEPPSSPAPSIPVAPSNSNSSLAEPAKDTESEDEGANYSKVWAKRSSKPLQQIYGHIDRMGEKDTGSLLDRYADRFGHELDREIIVLRGQASEAAKAVIRDAPVVEIIGDDIAEDDESLEPDYDEEDGAKAIDSNLTSEEEEELQEQLSVLEDEIRQLKPKYKMAKSKGNTRQLKKLKPALQVLMNERKMIMAVLSGDESIDILLAEGDEQGHDEDDSDGLFLSFVSIVDDLLGKMPSEAIDEFVASTDFDLYQQVASNPNEASHDSREDFFNLVDSKLGEMPENAINTFVASDDFSIYQEMGAYFRS